MHHLQPDGGKEDAAPSLKAPAVKTENEPYTSLPDHPRPVPLEVALTVMANQGSSCPHIIKVLDRQDYPDQYIVVLERPSPCVDKHDIWERHSGLFREDLARYFMWQVIAAAAVCCSQGVIHRDIKMPNILVNTETLEVKLIDFGCGDLLKSLSYITCSWLHMFEKGEYYEKQATVWSLGVLLFRMITSLFPDSSDIGWMDADVWFQPGFSDECCRFIGGCLKSDPERRIHLEDMLFHDWFKNMELQLHDRPGHTDAHHKGSSRGSAEIHAAKETPAKAAPVFPFIASGRSGASLSTSLVPEVPAKAALVQEDSVTATSEDPLMAPPVCHIKKTL
ncbi:hypothetical protein G5714_014795 [Onychostoma macrolepis]|uniref:non-specific serine/threonine protein kinase n=1 Tax=Onychostoma macrolepis TaxID=369639 RepID=A0A7J6C923_9TELE|nr:hypothetical protein G5714_014795 [Onychostoma macrolepis]